MKHQIRDAKQKLAKVTAFQNLDKVTEFWLKDYCQVLLAKYRERRMYRYFVFKGKKRICKTRLFYYCLQM